MKGKISVVLNLAFLCVFSSNAQESPLKPDMVLPFLLKSIESHFVGQNQFKYVETVREKTDGKTKQKENTSSGEEAWTLDVFTNSKWRISKNNGREETIENNGINFRRSKLQDDLYSVSITPKFSQQDSYEMLASTPFAPLAEIIGFLKGARPSIVIETAKSIVIKISSNAGTNNGEQTGIINQYTIDLNPLTLGIEKLKFEGSANLVKGHTHSWSNTCVLIAPERWEIVNETNTDGIKFSTKGTIIWKHSIGVLRDESLFMPKIKATDIVDFSLLDGTSMQISGSEVVGKTINGIKL